MKEKIKGKGSVGIAIAYFSLKGMISIPLEPCEYNLIFDDGRKLHRIKVISCSCVNPQGNYTATIRTMGGNRPNQTLKQFDKDSCDIVFVVTNNLDIYSIPSFEINSKRAITLNMYNQFKVVLLEKELSSIPS